MKRYRYLIVGGGMTADAAAHAVREAEPGVHVTMVFPEPAIGARPFPADLAKAVTEDYRARGVEVLAGETVAGLSRQGERTVVRTSGGREVTADAVVAGLGVVPSVELA